LRAGGVIPAWALAAAAKVRRREEKTRLEFLRRLPPNYPEPRAKQECQAYCFLRKWWTPNHIRRFISGYRTGKMIFPGILDSAGYPSVTEFQDKVGLLAEGEYARASSQTEMLRLLAGDDAVRGARSRERASEGGRARKEKTLERDIEMAREFQELLARHGGKSATSIKTNIAKKRGLSRSACIAAIDRGLRAKK